MTITESHYQFKINMDRIDSLSNPDFRPEEIDWLLNEAQRIFVSQRISSQSNPKRKGFEGSQKRIDDLSTLVVKYPLQPYLIPIANNGVYEVILDSLAFPYLHLLSGYVELEVADNCLKEARLRFVQHDDYRETLKDPFNSPSQEFIPFNFGRSSTGTSSIYMYPGQYTINKVYLEYLKRPRQVNLGNYTYIDGNVYPPTSFELPEHTHREIVDIACQIASLNVESPEYIRLRQEKVFLHE